MLDRHAVQELRRAGMSARAIAKQFGVSVRTIRRIGREAPVAESAEATARQGRGIGRPGVSAALRDRVAALLADDREAPPGEICRRLKEDGTPLGLSTVYRVLHRRARDLAGGDAGPL